MRTEKIFNIRVYGILINEKQEVLLSDENYQGQYFTKFPGGGLCYGEGVKDGLKREFKEEANLDIEVKNLIHITDNFIPSAFDQTQVIGIYYQVDALHELDLSFREVPEDPTQKQEYRWEPLTSFTESLLTFEMDRAAWAAIKKTGIAHK